MADEERTREELEARLAELESERATIRRELAKDRKKDHGQRAERMHRERVTPRPHPMHGC